MSDWPDMNDPPSTRAHKLRSCVWDEVIAIRERLAEGDTSSATAKYMQGEVGLLQMIATELENIVDQLQPPLRWFLPDGTEVDGCPNCGSREHGLCASISDGEAGIR